MSDFVVIDASVAVKWLVRESDSYEALELVTSWAAGGVTLVAPYLMPAEVSNALHKRVVSEELSVAAASHQVELLLASGVQLIETPSLHVRALAIASEFNQRAAYDAHYLALAEELDCDFWTADARFYRAAAPVVDRIRLLGATAS
ncbi:MAG: type II toxin-antitoxin system VapC family toxin [Chloroflexi bacterium]|nr:type II toxin-antitoxin system VapC family toxin [Chloroflexota bacterium]MYD64627.1 type II toxin-antitoxin system VapC family toxin [Chloroflexota bacterium]